MNELYLKQLELGPMQNFMYLIGDPGQLYESLNVKLKALDEATAVYPGHNYADLPTSTIGDEKRGNPFMQVPSREAFLRAIGRS